MIATVFNFVPLQGIFSARLKGCIRKVLSSQTDYRSLPYLWVRLTSTLSDLFFDVFNSWLQKYNKSAPQPIESTISYRYQLVGLESVSHARARCRLYPSSAASMKPLQTVNPVTLFSSQLGVITTYGIWRSKNQPSLVSVSQNNSFTSFFHIACVLNHVGIANSYLVMVFHYKSVLDNGRIISIYKFNECCSLCLQRYG